MITVGILPQKPVEIRYQGEWFNYLVEHTTYLQEKNKINLDIIYPKSKKEKKKKLVNKTDFFDSLADNINWETEQIKLLFENVNKYDVLLFMDISFTGLYTSLIPLIKVAKPNIKLYGFCHATSLNKGDIFKNTRKIKWQLEKYTINNFDGIFVATEYHKNKLVKQGKLNKETAKKIHITYGLPVSDNLFVTSKSKPKTENRNIIIPSRINKQKISSKKKDKFKRVLEKHGYNVIESYNLCNSRQEYVDLLKNSAAMIVLSNEDTFGYPLAEATACKLPCFAPKKCCYPEILNEESIFANVYELIDKLENIDKKRKEYATKKKYLVKNTTFWNSLLSKIRSENVEEENRNES